MAGFDAKSVLKEIKDEDHRTVFEDVLDALEGEEREVLNLVLDLAYKAGYRKARKRFEGTSAGASPDEAENEVAGDLTAGVPVAVPAMSPQAAAELGQATKKTSAEIISRIKSGQVKLPVFPHVAKKVLDMLEDPNLNVQKMAKEMKYDQALTSKIITISNSAFYGGTTQVKTLEASIVKIGLLEVRKHLYTLATKNIYSFDNPLFEDLVIRLGDHSTASANGAFNVSRALGLENHEKLLLNTLFHDVGKLWMVMVISDVLWAQKNKDEDFALALVEQLFPMAHAQMGGRLLQQWKFDQRFSQNVTAHHLAVDPKQKDLCALQFGNALAKSIGYKVLENDTYEKQLEQSAKALGIDEDDLEQYQDDLSSFMEVYKN
ncbi:MAG: hypothetical protein A2284_19230 [Deltaproteobacteria bacterium RIFOXYA12_FULL_61_11]|nr:MAG: hypothetical protein A2284_19230 [Deltaproteobacteria bacterium RIFOXYA12_FULL_61_11]